MSDNEFEDDIVFARFVKYMGLALINEKINYEKHNKFICNKEMQLNDTEWSKLPDKSKDSNPFDTLKRDYDDFKYALNKLTNKQRYVIINFYFKNKSLASIAEKMNSNINAVEQLKIRGLLSLRRYMEEK